MDVEGETYARLPGGPAGEVPPVLLLPIFDELPLAYRDLAFPPVPGHPHPPDAELRVSSVVAGDANVGTWRREVQGRAVEVVLALAPGLPDELLAGAEGEAHRLAAFLGRDLVLRRDPA